MAGTTTLGDETSLDSDLEEVEADKPTGISRASSAYGSGGVGGDN